MIADFQTTPVSSKSVWAGRIISALPVIGLLFSGTMKLLKAAPVVDPVKGFPHFGYPMSAIVPIGIAEVSCAILYLIPQTAVLGAILMTGYLGGATATHVRVGEPFFAPIIVGVLAWLGLLLRESRLQPLLPLRR